MSNDLVLGTLLSIPIGIATGLAVTPIQRWLETRGKANSAARTRRSTEEYHTLLHYRENPQMFTQYLVQVAIKTTLIASAVGIVTGIIYAATNLMDLGAFPVRHTFVSLLYFIAQIVVTMSSIVIVRICSPALMLWRRIQHFEDYAKHVPPEIRRHAKVAAGPA